MEKYGKIKQKNYVGECGMLNFVICEDEPILLKKYANEIICFYSDNDPYVKYEIEKEFADTIATKQVVLKGAGHINTESGFDIFEDIVPYI